MNARTRREFFSDVGRGMLVASVGYGAAAEMGFLSATLAGEAEAPLTFGELEPLVALMQETPIDRLQGAVVERLKGGVALDRLVAAAALANARSFGGDDYIGFHTMMALAPALHMARDMPAATSALPVLKVLYRNTNRIHEHGGRAKESLHAVEPAPLASGEIGYERLREAVRSKDLAKSEAIFARLSEAGADAAFHDLLYTVQDACEVHRVALAYRAWDLLGLIGYDHAHTMLRQSVHYCVNSESKDTRSVFTEPRRLLPRLFDQYGLDGCALGARAADDAWVEAMSRTIFEATPEGAADAVAAALAEGIAPSAVGEAMSLAANQLVLRDHGRRPQEVQVGKPLGSVHGDSVGVHACDSANAWRNMARVSDARHTFASLIIGSYQVALDRVNRGGDFMNWRPHPLADKLEEVRATEPDKLLEEADAAVRDNDQALAAAVVHRYGELAHPPRAVFDLLLSYGVSQDGSLHAEKYYQTVSEEFAMLRPAFRWRQVTALARVTASEYGRPAPGHEEACQLIV